MVGLWAGNLLCWPYSLLPSALSLHTCPPCFLLWTLCPVSTGSPTFSFHDELDPQRILAQIRKMRKKGEIHNLLLCWTIAEYYLGLKEGRCLPGVALSVEISLSERKGSSDCSHPLLLQRWVVPRISQLLALILNSFLVLDTGLRPLQKHSIIKPSPNCPVPCGVNSALPREVSAWAPDLPLNPATLTNSGVAGGLSFLGRYTELDVF